MSSDSAAGASKNGGGPKLALLGGVTVLSLAGGTIGYAGIDPEFRTYVENLVPGAKEVFVNILGNPDEQGGYVPAPRQPTRAPTCTKAQALLNLGKLSGSLPFPKPMAINHYILCCWACMACP